MVQAPDPPLERQTLERLERLALRWRQSFTGLLGGNNVSRFSGVGHEFLDHRHFHHGDDLRSVNWRAFLRLERLFLKMFRTEPRTPVRILLDASESMSCGAVDGRPGEAKFSYACRLAAALTYVGLVRLETMVLQPFGQGLAESFRAQGGRHRYAPAARFLSGLRTAGRSDFRETARQFAHRYGSAGLAIVISDFLDDGSAASALDVLAEQGHELYLVHLAGPADREPPWRGGSSWWTPKAARPFACSSTTPACASTAQLRRLLRRPRADRDPARRPVHSTSDRCAAGGRFVRR